MPPAGLGADFPLTSYNTLASRLSTSSGWHSCELICWGCVGELPSSSPQWEHECVTSGLARPPSALWQHGRVRCPRPASLCPCHKNRESCPCSQPTATLRRAGPARCLGSAIDPTLLVEICVIRPQSWECGRAVLTTWLSCRGIGGGEILPPFYASTLNHHQ